MHGKRSHLIQVLKIKFTKLIGNLYLKEEDFKPLLFLMTVLRISIQPFLLKGVVSKALIRIDR